MTDITPELLRQLAEDMEQRPDEECWQYRALHDCWCVATARMALERALESYSIRRKPRMIRVTHEFPDGTVRVFEYPEPVREPLENGQGYWLAVLSPHGIHRWEWHGTKDENHLLDLGLIHLTKEAAEAHRRAMVGEDGDE